MTVDHNPQRNFLNFSQLDTSSTEEDTPSLVRLECVSSTLDYSQNAVPSQHVEAACPRVHASKSRVSGADVDSSLATTMPARMREGYAQAEWKQDGFFLLKALFLYYRIL